ncbi:hypothetical protein [Gordonia paraffinivorans]|uniref:hypothetical protein n=1 Tax=Gordonia paraffinivorans TaxID=175628 RepID=UPI002431324F|nr:hypothetical protein [Gordonia paraffinivorans]
MSLSRYLPSLAKILDDPLPPTVWPDAAALRAGQLTIHDESAADLGLRFGLPLCVASVTVRGDGHLVVGYLEDGAAGGGRRIWFGADLDAGAAGGVHESVSDHVILLAEATRVTRVRGCTVVAVDVDLPRSDTYDLVPVDGHARAGGTVEQVTVVGRNRVYCGATTEVPATLAVGCVVAVAVVATFRWSPLSDLARTSSEPRQEAQP